MNGPSEDNEPFPPFPESDDVPSGMDRRSFLMRAACIGAAAVMARTTWAP